MTEVKILSALEFTLVYIKKKKKERKKEKEKERIKRKNPKQL